MSIKRKVLVFGATGQQGGAVIKALLSDGHEVVGLTRNLESDKAKALETLGVSLVQGNIHQADQLVDIMKTVDTVFALTTPYEEGTEREKQQGLTLAEAAKTANVGHLIFSSVSDANTDTGIPHFESKYAVEQKIAALEIPHTILAPVYFMENLLSPWTIDAIKTGKISQALPGGVLLQQISVNDIAQFVAEVVNGREKYFSQRINIAGDELTGQEVAEKLTTITGKKFTYEGFSPDFLKESMPDIALMYEWFDKVGYSANVLQLKKDFPKVSLTSFESYAQNQDWHFLE